MPLPASIIPNSGDPRAAESDPRRVETIVAGSIEAGVIQAQAIGTSSIQAPSIQSQPIQTPSIEVPAIGAPVAEVDAIAVPECVVEPVRSTEIQAAPRPEISRWRRPLRRNERTNSVFGIPVLLGKLRSLWWWWALLLGVCAFPGATRAQSHDSECGGRMTVGDKFLFYTDGEWPAGMTITVQIHAPLPAGMSDEQALDGAAVAIAHWNEALCNQLTLQLNPVVLDAETPAPETPTVTLRFSDVPLQTSSGRSLFGYTINRAEGGVYVGSDILLNGVDPDWTHDGCGVGLDLVGVLLHELGHSLGLDHSADMTAAMRGSSPAARTWELRHLRDDDRLALAGRYGCEVEASPPGPDDLCATCIGAERCADDQTCEPFADGTICLARCVSEARSCDEIGADAGPDTGSPDAGDSETTHDDAATADSGTSLEDSDVDEGCAASPDSGSSMPNGIALIAIAAFFMLRRRN
jgi:MYXO-CTERM domain-containing protein